MPIPKTTDQWVITGTSGFDSLELQKNVPIPEPGDFDVLVQIQAVSLNYRDLAVPQGKYPFPMELPKVACSDGAGNVVAVGKKVTDFLVGDKVCTLFNQDHQAGPLSEKALDSGLGGELDGTLRQYGVFPQTGLVLAPSNIPPDEASTLTCAPLTAWNAFYGLESKALRPGDCVLTQGTGGVSIAGIQFAKAAGATVIATTSSDEKAKFLEKLGANVVINYKKDPNWGETAKKLSPGKLGCDHVIEVGGPRTMKQSMQAVKLEGVISVIGFLSETGAEDTPSALDVLTYLCTIRGIVVGSRLQFEAMNRCIEANNIHPMVDKTRFGFEDAKEAHKYQWDQKNLGKVVIQPGRLR